MASLLSWTFHIVYEIHGAVTASQLSWTFHTWVQTPCARQKPPYMLKLSQLWDLPMLHCNPHQNPDTYMDCYEKVCIPTKMGLHNRNRLWHSYKSRDNIKHVTPVTWQMTGKEKTCKWNEFSYSACVSNQQKRPHPYIQLYDQSQTLICRLQSYKIR